MRLRAPRAFIIMGMTARPVCTVLWRCVCVCVCIYSTVVVVYIGYTSVILWTLWRTLWGTTSFGEEKKEIKKSSFSLCSRGQHYKTLLASARYFRRARCAAVSLLLPCDHFMLDILFRLDHVGGVIDFIPIEPSPTHMTLSRLHDLLGTVSFLSL